MKRRSLVALLLAVVLAAAHLAAFADNAQDVNATGYPIMNVDHKFRIVHSVSNGDLIASWADKAFTQKIKDETGLDIEWIGISQNTYSEQVGIMIAANDMPDAFFYGVPNFSQFTGSFIPLNDLIDTYAPKAASFFEAYPAIKAASLFPDGALYGLPQVQMNNFYAPNALFINTRWLEAVGMQAPNNLDELYEVLKAFKEKDANGNGDPNDEIPLSFTRSETLIMYLSAFDIFGSGAMNEAFPYLMLKDGQIVFYPETENYRRFLEYMHKLYAEGLIDPNCFVQEEQDIQAKGKNNLLGIFAGTSYVDVLAGDNAADYTYLLPLANSEGKRSYVPSRFSGDVNLNRFVISKECKYPEAMLRLYNYLNESYENRLRFDWGEEGIAWEKTENGQIQRLNAKVPEGYSNYAEVRHTRSMGIMGPILWDDADQATFAITNPRDMTYYQRQEPLMQYAITEQIPLGQDTAEASSEIAIILTEMRTYMDNFQAVSIMKGIDDAQWEQHLKNVKTFGSEDYVSIRQAYYDRVQANMK